MAEAEKKAEVGESAVRSMEAQQVRDENYLSCSLKKILLFDKDIPHLVVSWGVPPKN